MPRKAKVTRPDIEEMEKAESTTALEKPEAQSTGATVEPRTATDAGAVTSPSVVISKADLKEAETSWTPGDGLPVLSGEQIVNGVLAQQGGPTLEEIMGAPDGDPELKPFSAKFSPMIGKTLDDFEKDVVVNQINTLRERVRVSSDADITQILQAVIDGKWSRKVMMLTPFNRPINPHAHFAMMANLRKNPWLGYHYETDTVIQRARNILAHKFLESDAEYSWWVDQDTVPPFGDPGFFYVRFGAAQSKFPPAFAGINALPQLLSHKKTIVGAVYAQRKPNGTLVIQPDLHPRNADDKELVKKLRNKGPFHSLVEVGYVATGCALVHRSVYEAIKQKLPDLAPKNEKEPWNFFGRDVEGTGEDIHFCRLAAVAGHPSFLDTSVVCAHLGEYAYMP